MKSLIGRIMIEAQKQRVRRVHHPRPGHTFVEDHPRIGGHAFAVFSLPGLQVVGVRYLLLPEVLASHCAEPQERLRIGLLQLAQHDYSPDRRSEEHTSELQSRFDLVCRLLLVRKKPRASRGGCQADAWSPP